VIRNFKNSVAISALVVCLGIYAGQAAAAEFTDAQKQEIKKVIQDYLKEDPGIVMEALQMHRDQQEQKMTANAEEIIKQNMDKLTSKESPSVGNPKGDVTVIEFFDYNCGYCKRALEDIQNVLKTDKNVNFVFKELPILGPTSEVAARWAEAAHRQGKYFEYHAAVMHNSEPISEESLEKVGEDIGLDVEKLRKDAQSDEVRQSVLESRNLAMQIQIQGTPGFIINGKLYRGYLGPDGLVKAIEEARSGKKE
jgi:protein-disulfide isomerase